MRQCEHGCNGCENCTDYEGTNPMTTRNVPEALRLADELIEQATSHLELAHCCDCRPEDTVNWSHYMQCGKAAAELRRLQAEVEALRGGWIPVTERLPDLHVDVLAGYWYQNNWLKGKPWMFSFGICLMYEEPNDPCFPQGKRWKTHGCSHNDIKHWMPLPTPPAQDIPKEDIQ